MLKCGVGIAVHSFWICKEFLFVFARGYDLMIMSQSAIMNVFGFVLSFEFGWRLVQ